MAVQNNPTATGGATGAGWKPGQSGNPGGRPKGLASAVREKAPPDKLVKFYLAVFLAGTDESLLDDELRAILGNTKVTLRDRLEAGDWLTERGYGKAAQFAPIDGDDPLELETLTGLRLLVDDLAGFGTNTGRAPSRTPTQTPPPPSDSGDPPPPVDEGREAGAAAA